jgi:hypothetical protein
MPERILYAEPLRRRMRVKFGDRYIVDSEDVMLLHEPVAIRSPTFREAMWSPTS